MSLFSDCAARDRKRRREANAALPYQVHRLRKDGQPSGDRFAREGFATQDAALHYVAMVRRNNPSSSMRFTLNGEEV